MKKGLLARKHMEKGVWHVSGELREEARTRTWKATVGILAWILKAVGASLWKF